MSEKLHSPKGQEHKSEGIDASAEARRNLERIHKEAEKENHPGHHAEQLKVHAKEQAVSGKEITIGERESAPSQMGVQRELKLTAYKQTIRRIQTKLKGPEKVLSRVMHQPVVEKISNVGANTVARPSGILGGGFIALLGSSILLYLTKHYGFEYNLTVFFILFVVGFMAGIILEGLVKLVRRKRSIS